MKTKTLISGLIAILILSVFALNDAVAEKKKVAQSGMNYLAISMAARETALGNASTAIVRGINGLWHNPAVLSDISGFAFALNQVNWLVETKLYGAALAYHLGKWGTLALDLTYMDYGKFEGTRPVDRSVDYRGFVLTGDIDVEDYAFGLGYAIRISDRFALGFKLKRVHESLGNARYVVRIENEGTENEVKHYEEQTWGLSNWGMDFGTVYDIGWKSLTFAIAMQNLSSDMKYWFEEFQLPMSIKMGMAMDATRLFMSGNENLAMNIAVDAVNPIDYTARIHTGAELVYMQRFALRGGYQFNHDVESFSFGLGLNITVGGLDAVFDYAFTHADYFEDVNRFSIQFEF